MVVFSIHPSRHSSIQVPHPEEEDNGKEEDEWRQEQFIQMFMWSNPVVLQFAKSYKLIFKN